MSKEKLLDLIPDIFSDIISASNFLVSDESKDWEHINLCNDSCIIQFIDDFGWIEVSFVDPKEKIEAENSKRDDGFPTLYPFYPVFAVWKFLYLNDKTDYSSNSWNRKDQLEVIKRLFEERLENVVKADFSWTKAFKKL